MRTALKAQRRVAEKRRALRVLARPLWSVLPFSVWVEYDYDYELEKDIKKRMGKCRYEGGGHSYLDDLDDMSFGFATRRMAIARAKRLKKVLGRKVRVRVEMPDPGLWGIILVDAAHHIADAMVRHGVTYVTPNGPQEMTARDALDRIRELFDKEWEHRTDTVEHVEFD